MLLDTLTPFGAVIGLLNAPPIGAEKQVQMNTKGHLKPKTWSKGARDTTPVVG